MARRWLIFGFLLALFLLLTTRHVSSEPYGYDEADYMYAASLGFAANWSDTPSISTGDFVRAGRDARSQLSQRIRASNDVLFYRHFHGPLFNYLLICLSHLRLSERAMRVALLAIPCVSVAVIYFGSQSWLAAILFLCSYSVFQSTEIAPHQLFALCSLLSLLLLLKAVATARRVYWYGSVVATGLAFCTLELALALLLTLGICGFIERRRWHADGWFVAKSVGLFLGTVLAIWPAVVLKLSFVKACLVMAYLSVLRPHAWGNVSFAQAWTSRVFNSPVEWALILVGVAVCFRNRSALYPLGVFAGITLLGTLHVVTVTPRYALAFVPVLDLLAGLALVPLLGPLRRPASCAVVTLAVAGLCGNAWYQASYRPHNPNPRSAAVVTYIHQNKLENKAVLAPQDDIPTLHYYFPGLQLRGYLGPSSGPIREAKF